MRVEPIGERLYPLSLYPDTNLFNVIAGRFEEEEQLNPFKINLENQLNYQKLEEEVIPNSFFNRVFLQYPNEILRELAYSIVDPEDSNDEKVRRITSWVIKNIKYAEDIDNYGYEEFWIPPILTLRKGSGDCEDGAFLIHSLLLNADVPAYRLRTYGGLVQAADGARSGGHAWTAYQRESDNEWVVIDFSFLPDL